MFRPAVLRICCTSLIGCTLCCAAASFTNPLLPSGADPWVIYRAGFYYYMSTNGKTLVILKTRDITDLRHAERKVVWNPPRKGPYAHRVWAPELHFLDGKWYLYFAADSGKNSMHRIWVLENASPDPLSGTWSMKGELADPKNRFAIDPTVFEHAGRLYALWSGWPQSTNGTQDIYICRLKNPWTVADRPVLLSSPQYPWEKFGDLGASLHINVNEAPEILEHGGKIFLIYSASGCWTDHYALGMLTASEKSDVLDPASWIKSPEPVFSTSAAAQAYGPGHSGFFQSPDGKQYWIIYHANPEPREGCGAYRSPRAQPFTWRPDGSPDFGTPVALGQSLPKPSGTQ